MEIIIYGSDEAGGLETYDLVREVLKEIDKKAEIKRIRKIEEVTDNGIHSTPALVVNGLVVSIGNIPSREVIKKAIKGCKKAFCDDQFGN
ncbi:thioredoxin family protein [Candidatus Dojkabacteria bacterium]|nr:thioredoxin family protein [Candidatus Dojkabacteria bacterium]